MRIDGLPLIVAAASVAACGDAATASRGEAAAGAALNAPWELQEDLRLGSATAAGAEQFSWILDIEVDRRGNIYVLDGIAQEVRVFSPDGAHVRTIGGQGEGPGEFVGAEDLALDPEGRLWVIDARTSRYSVFSPQGDYVTGHARPLRGSGGAVFGPDGRLMDRGFSFPLETPEVVAGPIISFDFVRFEADFASMDTLPPLVFEQDMVPDGSRPQVFYADSPRFFLTRSGDTWFGHASEYRLLKRNLRGDTTGVISLEVEPIPLGDAEREEVRSGLTGRPDILEGYLAGLPETRPVLQRLFGDHAGHIFVIPDVEGAPDGSAVDVFTDEGAYLGRSILPEKPGRGPVIATETHLYMVVSDELDVPYVSRLRITKPGE